MKAVFLITGGLFLAGICFVVYCCLCAASGRMRGWSRQGAGQTIRKCRGKASEKIPFAK